MLPSDALNNIPEKDRAWALEMMENIMVPPPGETLESFYKKLSTPIKEQVKPITGEDVSMRIMASVSPETFSQYFFNQALYSNQVDIVNAILDPRISKLQVVEPRQVGKTTSLAVGSAMALEYNAIPFKKTNPNEPYRVGIFAPKLMQGQIDLNRVKSYCSKNARAYGLVNWGLTNASKIVWHNGAELHAVSASDQAESEGQTFNLLIIEEAQRVSDYAISEKILPMGGATGAKIVKVGTVRAVRNHFWRGWHEPLQGYHKISHTWTNCPLLLQGGYLEANVNGELVQLSKYVMERMPLSIKQLLFPANPELWIPGDMDESDFRTQYLLEWLETSGLFLNAKERESIIGTHELQQQQMGQEWLVAGVDFAGPGDDETAISIMRVTGTKVKEKIWGCTFSRDSANLYNHLIEILHPQKGKFRPRKIFADETGIGFFPSLELEKMGLPIKGINFGETEPDSAISNAPVNYKNAMFSYAHVELNNERFKYAKKKNHAVPTMNVDYHKGLDQWYDLEIETSERRNKRIGHPDGKHDDIVVADVLAIWASKTDRAILSGGKAYNYPGGVSGNLGGPRW